MRNNRALSRAAGSLIHPLTLVAIVILLINDHILRWIWPSWVWGKLGDFSWPIFFPFIPALILSFVVPKRWKNQEALVAGLSFASTGLFFSFMKTVPAAHAAGLHLIRSILNAPFILRLDPTDLFALPGLLIGWHIWQRVNPERQFKIAQAYPILILSTLVPNPIFPPYWDGIDCLYLQNDGTIIATLSHLERSSTLYSSPAYKTFESHDGGVTWLQIEVRETDKDHCFKRNTNVSWATPDQGKSQILYRFTPENKVYISSDRGDTWEFILDLSKSEAEITYYTTTQAYFDFTPGPFDAIADRDTGNLIMAMGIEGILTRTPSGELIWFEDVSQYYHRVHIGNPFHVVYLLRIECILAVILFFLVGSTASLHIAPPKSFWQAMITTASVVWIGITATSPALAANWMVIIIYGMYLIPVLLLLVPALLIGFKAMINQYNGETTHIITTSLIVSLLFLLPYILWSQDIIHKYIVAMIAALVLASGSTVIGIKELIRIHEAASEQTDDDAPSGE